jgi:CPA2 family monovalent cation:H+ antiporter-2
MTVESPLIAILVLGLGLAFVFGALAQRLRISPIVGYLMAGVVVGPFTPGFVADSSLAPQLADVGVILLMFGVGLHFSLKDLFALRRVVVPGAVAQVAVSSVLGMGIGWLAGWGIGGGIVFGMALAIASTVVLTRALNDRHVMDTERGHMAVGWLIVQDLLTVLALVMLPPLAGLLGSPERAADLDLSMLTRTLALTFGKLAAFVALMLIVGKRVIPAVLHYIAHTGSRELFRLAVLSVALGVAFIAAELFGVSFALGAFFGGLVLSESELSQRAAEESLPLRDAFAVLFFVSVGMLFNPAVILTEASLLAATLAVVTIGNATVAFFILRAFGRKQTDAMLIAVGLAQIGEFSFILSDLGIGLDILPERARNLILGASILSIFLNPALFALADRVRARTEPRPTRAQTAQRHAHEAIQPSSAKDHAVLIGYGRVGQIVGDDLMANGWPVVVIEDATDTVERLRAGGVEVISGNAADERVLRAANVPEARLLVIAIPNGFEAGQIAEQARRANPNIETIARAHFDAEVDYLKRHGANEVIMGEREIARAMMDYARLRKPAAAAAS